MICLYTGTPGSGKSLHCISDIIRWIKILKSPVIGNFIFDFSKVNIKGYGAYLYVDNNMLTPDLLIRFSDRYRDKRKWKRIPEEHILLIIDECQLLYNCRNWNDKNRKEWVSFFSQHRKLGYKIILICQFAEMIDKQIRSLVEYEYVHRKVKNIGMAGRIINFFSLGNLHIAIKYYSPIREVVGREFFKGKKSYYELYDSYNRF